TAPDVCREHAALSAFENDGARDSHIGGLTAISDADYDALEPVQWPIPSPPPERGGHRRPSAAVFHAKNADAQHRLCAEGDQVRVPLTLSKGGPPPHRRAGHPPPPGGGGEKRLFSRRRVLAARSHAPLAAPAPPP